MGEPTVMCLRSLNVWPGLPTQRRDPPDRAHLLPGRSPYTGAESRGGVLPSQLGQAGWATFAHQLTHGASGRNRTTTTRLQGASTTFMLQRLGFLVLPFSFVFGYHGTEQFALDDSAFALRAIRARPIHCQIDLACLAHAIAWS